ncbi:hypothetical protein GDO86_019938, partial [Hymenochirus boettgeri]
RTKINKNFKSAWEKAKDKWNKGIKSKVESTLPDGFKENYGITLVAYTGEIHDEFNRAARAVGKSRDNYMNNFHFKSFHYYLTMALRKLTNGCTKRTVYRGEKNVHFMPPREGNDMRFGQITSTSYDRDTGEMFGVDTFYEIHACYGVPIEDFTQFSFQNEVLVPGNEMFTVKSFERLTYKFTLDSNERTCSDFNCAYLQGQ